MSKDTQLDMPGQGRTFRRKTSRFWGIWPMPEAVDEIHRVVFVDGIWIARDLVVLIACSELVFATIKIDTSLRRISTFR